MQVPQLAFQGRPPAPEPVAQPAEPRAAETSDDAGQPVVGDVPRVPEAAPPVNEQMVQGLVVGGAALVYEDAIEPPPDAGKPTPQVRGAPTDQVATPSIVEPEPPAAVPEDHRPAPGARRWFLRRHPTGEPEPDRAEDAAATEQLGAEIPQVEEAEPVVDVAPELVAPTWEVAFEERLQAPPFEPEPEPEPELERAPEFGEDAVSGPVEERMEEPPRRRRGLLWKRPAPQAAEQEAEAEPTVAAPPEEESPVATFQPEPEVSAPQAVVAEEKAPVSDYFAPLPTPAPVEEAEAELVGEEPSAPETQAEFVQESQEPVPPRGKRWLRRRGPPAPAAQTAAPSEESDEEVIHEVRSLEEPAAQAAQAVEVPEAPPAPADLPERPAAAVRPPAPITPPEAAPQEAPARAEEPYYVETAPPAGPVAPPRPQPEAKPSMRGRLRRRRPESAPGMPPEAGPARPAPLSTPVAPPTSRPASPAEDELSPSVFAALASSPIAPPQAPPMPPPKPARVPVEPPQAQSPLAPPSAPPPARVAPPPTTSAWKSSMPEPPPARAYAAGVRSGPSPATTEITCPRCGQPSPRGLCETCEYALLELRELMIGLSEDQ